MWMQLAVAFVACRPHFPEPSGDQVVARHGVVVNGVRLGWLLGPAETEDPERGRWDVDPAATAAALGVGRAVVGFVDRRISVVEEGALRAEAGPAILLLPGAVNLPHQSTALALELASHGHLVLQLDLGLGPQELGLPTEATEDAAWRTYEILEVDALPQQVARVQEGLAWLAAPTLSVPADEAPMIAGHSHGGGVAMEACRTERCLGVVNLDGPVYASVRTGGVEVPWLHVASRDPDQLTEEQLDALGWAAFYPEVKRTELGWVDEARAASPVGCSVFMDQSGHLDFTDFPFLVPRHRSDLPADVAHARTVQAVRAAHAFFTASDGACAAIHNQLNPGFTPR